MTLGCPRLPVRGFCRSLHPSRLACAVTRVLGSFSPSYYSTSFSSVVTLARSLRLRGFARLFTYRARGNSRTRRGVDGLNILITDVDFSQTRREETQRPAAASITRRPLASTSAQLFFGYVKAREVSGITWQNERRWHRWN